jgi:hypothetical protein
MSTWITPSLHQVSQQIQICTLNKSRGYQALHGKWSPKKFLQTRVLNGHVYVLRAWIKATQIPRAYFETRTGLGLGPGLGLEENPDSRKTRTRTRKNSGLVFNKTRTWLLKTRTRNRQNRIQNKDSVYENA